MQITSAAAVRYVLFQHKPNLSCLALLVETQKHSNEAFAGWLATMVFVIVGASTRSNADRTSSTHASECMLCRLWNLAVGHWLEQAQCRMLFMTGMSWLTMQYADAIEPSQEIGNTSWVVKLTAHPY